MKKPSDSAPAAALILLVDDNRNGLLLRKSILEDESFKVTTCRTTDEAAALLRTEPFDAVITVHRMPKMDGVEFIKQMREVRTDLPVLLMSGMVDVLGLNERSTGANAVVAQGPNEAAHMIRALKRVVKLAKAQKKPARSQKGSTAKLKSAGS
jgi:DNA-binding NtrC family response regulator